MSRRFFGAVRAGARHAQSDSVFAGIFSSFAWAPAEATKLRADAEALDGLAALVARFLPREPFGPAADDRERIFSPWVTFVAFLGQVLTRGSACRKAVRRVQA